MEDFNDRHFTEDEFYAAFHEMAENGLVSLTGVDEAGNPAYQFTQEGRDISQAFYAYKWILSRRNGD